MNAALEYFDVYKSFDAPVLRGVSLRVEPGETLAIVGRSGVGKSVLLKIAIGLLEVDSGEVAINGTYLHSASQSELERLRRKVGYVFQSAALFDSLTVYENVSMGLGDSLLSQLSLDDAENRVQAALESVNMDYGAVVNKLPAELSGGMRKRVGLARALVGQPDILLFDEPVTGLDPLTSAMVSYLIGKTTTQVTSLLVTHDVEGALELADRIAFLADGKLVFVGTPEQFHQSSHPLVRAFGSRQVAKETAISMMEQP